MPGLNELSFRLFLFDIRSLFSIDSFGTSDTLSPQSTSVYLFYDPYYQEKISVTCIPPLTPLLYSITGVCAGIPIFLIFAP